MRFSVAWLLCLLQGAAVAEVPGDFAFAIPLASSGPAALFRIDLPQAVYEGVSRADLGDLRVFNAAGEPVPHAFLPRTVAAREKRTPLRLPFFALRGDTVAGVEGLDVRIERASGRAVLTINERGRAPARDAPLLGYLVDATAVELPLQALLLELPPGSHSVATRVRVDVSDDLARWTTLVADAPVLQLEQGGQRLEQLRVEFSPRQARYFRLAWPGVAQPLPLAGLTGEPGEALVDLPRHWKEVVGSAEPAGEYTFDLAGQFPVDRLRLTLPQPNSIASVEILARSRSNDPWRRIAVATVYRLGVGSGEVVNPELVIAPTSDRYWRLRVDPRGGGLGVRTPQLAAGWVPHGVVFAARGGAPFELAYGSGRAGPAAYPITTLVPGYRVEDAGQASPVPIGQAITGSVRTLAGESAMRTPVDWRRWALWGSLLLGVALLAGMALRLGRQLARSPPQQNGPDEH